MLGWLKSFWNKHFLISREKLDISKVTPRAIQVLAIARREARGFADNEADVEHVLIGLLMLGQGVAFDILLKRGLTAEKVRDEIRKSRGVATPGTAPSPEDIPYTKRVGRALLLANRESFEMGHGFLGVEHLLLGLLEAGGNVGCLKQFKLDVKAMREEVRKELKAVVVPPPGDAQHAKSDV